MAAASIERLEAVLSRFGRLGLAHLPTPLEPMKRLSAHLGGPRLWVKRDDCTGLGLGGNKLRKLDYVLREAIDGGADTLVSGGVVQSNSQRQVAAAAARLGLGCHLAVYHGRLAPPSAEYERNGNALLNRLFGATLHDVPWNGDRNGAIAHLADTLSAQGRKPYIVPYGVSSPLGALAYASTAAEIARQGATLGLVVGASLCLPGVQIVGIDIDAEPARVRADVLAYGKAAAARLDQPFDTDAVEVVAGHAGPAYGVPHAATVEAIRLGAALEGLVLDPVYSGKGLAGLIALVRAGRWTSGQDIVFIHTGGAPGLFAYRHLFD
jgi:L-cysteate sulfo-lyase